MHSLDCIRVVCTYRGLKQPKTPKTSANIISVMLTLLIDKVLVVMNTKN